MKNVIQSEDNANACGERRIPCKYSRTFYKRLHLT